MAGGEPEAPGPARTKFYALEAIGGMEERVALVIAFRADTKDLDIKSIVVPSDLKGIIIVEANRMKDLIDATIGVRNLKRKRPIPLKPEDVERIVKPAVEVAGLNIGDVVEVVAGPFKGRRGKVVEVSESKGEVKLQIIEAESRMIATVPIDEVRKVEE